MGFLNGILQGSFALGLGITCLTVLPFLLIAGVFVYIARRNVRQADASANWSSVTGVIGASSVQARTSSNSEGGTSTSYYPELLYEYRVGDNRYVGQRITFGTQVGYGDRNRAQAVVDRYMPGNQVPVYYNPNNYADSVLERSAGTGTQILFWIGLLILLIVCITLGSMLFIFGGIAAMFNAFGL